ncbi:hypothetical protein KIN20_000701 [Parelaphostrongylus tenuis]|uniref:Uncharacterized protein n=1 Tax=Parelaphostrongylus tenuis TaxID=148309 RepID=A0AAD5LSY3_PARTN|nr:hypothetical protein KIN20_000701 [Parelaphostrongylus tenuis]
MCYGFEKASLLYCSLKSGIMFRTRFDLLAQFGSADGFLLCFSEIFQNGIRAKRRLRFELKVVFQSLEHRIRIIGPLIEVSRTRDVLQRQPMTEPLPTGFLGI